MVKLAGGNGAVALLCNTLPTGAILVVHVLIFGPLSGAHINPAVSLAFALRGELPWRSTGLYILTQVGGGVIRVWAAHLMFDLPMWQLSTTMRIGPAQWFAGLTIFGTVASAPLATPYAVGLYVTSAYWFTASTSFANASWCACIHSGAAFRDACGCHDAPLAMGRSSTRPARRLNPIYRTRRRVARDRPIRLVDKVFW
jgi:glycerol uptake facilitator-like aquaporin